MQNITMSVTSSTDPGSLSGSVARYTRLQASVTAQQTSMASQQAKVREQLVTQFASANALVAGSKSTLTFLQNQIAAWNKSTS